jgi:hypothetical protein
MKRFAVILLQLLLWLPLSSFAASYYVTQSGAGSQNGADPADAWSLASYNETTIPSGGDTVFFSGIFTSKIVARSGGTGNGASRLTLDLTAATINAGAVTPYLSLGGHSYITVNGGTFGSPGSSVGRDIISFGGDLHDITIQKTTWTGDPEGVAGWVDVTHGYNVLIQNNHADNVGADGVWSDGAATHDVVIQNNFIRTSLSSAVDIDVIQIADAANVTIQGNKLINRAVSSERSHQDVIQTYMKGGSDHAHPTNWIIRYNWLEGGSVGGSGDNSWLMMENMDGNPACQLYGNVFYGNPTQNTANNGCCFNSNQPTAVFYFYNNTVIRTTVPDNTIRFLAPGQLYAENNVGMCSPPTTGTCLVWTMNELGRWDHNFFYQFPYATSKDSGPHGSIRANPSFDNFSGADFSLASGSPLIGAGDGTIGPQYAKGIAPGAKWPNPKLVSRSAGAWDVGAYQSVQNQSLQNRRSRRE